MIPFFQKIALAWLLVAGICVSASAQRQMEKLGRGVFALKSSGTQVYIGWRLLGNDPEDIAFNLYRSANGGVPLKINTANGGAALTATTDYTDTPGNLTTTAYTYSVRPVVGGVEVPDLWANPLSPSFTLPANAPTRQYLSVPIQPINPPPDGAPNGALKVGFCWVGDLDGDGEYDYVIARHNQHVANGREFLEGYKRDGTFLWRLDMGPNSTNHYNIEPGSSTIGNGHGDNVTVYDMDGDGKAEAIVRTANGVVFGNGTVLAAANNNSQFISIVNGETGAEMARAPVPNPYLSDGPMNAHMAIFYPDGQRPSVILAGKNRRADNGFQGLSTAWDYRNGALTQRWSYNSATLNQHAPEGHQVRIGDVENDGKDEFVDIGYTIDDNGLQMHNTGEIVHGDRFHMTDIDPDRPGLETYIIQQDNSTGLATAILDPATGGFVKKWYAAGVVDVGRGLAADIDPAQKGLEVWSTQGGIFNAKGVQIYNDRPFPPEAIWWDSNLSREFLATVGSTSESPAIARFDSSNPGAQGRVYTIYNEDGGCYWGYGGRPAHTSDLLGDWREEIVVIANGNSAIRIYTTKNAAENRIYTPMHNAQYRVQATTKGYVQSSYVDYYLGDGMTVPQPPPMVDAQLVWRGGAGATTWDQGVTPGWQAAGVNSTFANGNTVRFDIGGNNSTTVALSGALQPGNVAVWSPKSYQFDGSNGSLGGSMKLVKAGAGTLTLSGMHGFTGKTTVWDGAMVINGTLSGSAVTVWGGTFGGVGAGGLQGGRIGGSGTFAQPVIVKYRGGIAPGSGMGNAGTLNFGAGLTAEDGSVLALDLSNDPGGMTTPGDRIAVTGNLVLIGKVNLFVKALNGTPPPGSYTLLTYTGTLTGNLGNLAVIAPPGLPYTLTVGGGAIILTVPVTPAPGSVTWRGSGASWDLAASQNWLRAGSPGVFVSADAVTFDAIGAAAQTATLSTVLPVAGVTVNAASDYTFAGVGSLSGSGGLTKSGAGTLTINTTNDYTGPTTVTGGVLAIANLATAGSPSSIGASSAAASNLVLNAGTLRLSGAQTSTNRSLTLGASGGTLDIASSGSSIQISGTITGSGTLTKSGPGTILLASANNYTGGTIINGGTIYLAGRTANVSGMGSGSVTINGGTLTMANVQGSEAANWNLIIPAGATGRLNADGRCSLNGTLTGSGIFNYYTPFIRTDLRGNWSAFTGRINVVGGADGGDFRVTNSNGYGTAAIDLADTALIYYNSTNSSPTLNIGELTGVANSGLAGGPSSGSTVTWRVGGRNTDATFAGSIVNSAGPTAIIKNGTGSWTLTGASTHTGATTVSAGILRINGSTNGTAITVQSAAALGGTGTITGNVTVQSGGVIEHNAIGLPPLAINGNLVFGTSATVRPIPGIVVGTGTYAVLTYTGTLTGTPSLSWQAPAESTLIASFDLSTSGVISMTLNQDPGAVDPGNLVWAGNSSSVWDFATSNWAAGSGPAVYANDSTVSFTDSGNAANPIEPVSDVVPEAVIVDSSKNYTLAGTNKITGTAVLTKSGTGNLTLSNGTFNGSGGLILAGGNTNAANGNFVNVSAGPIEFRNGAVLTHANGANTTTVNSNLFVDSGQSGTINMGGRFSLGNNATTYNVTGSGILTFNAQTTNSRNDLSSNFTAFTGTMNVTGSGNIRLFINGGKVGIGFPLATLNVGGAFLTPQTNSTGNTIQIGALGGSSPNGGLAGGSAGTATYLIGGKNLNTTFAGQIAGNAAVTKTGTGTLALAGSNTYTGATAVNAGKVIVTGSLASLASTTIAPAGELGGTGSIAGPVTCNGTLAPGNSAGTLTLNAGLVLSSSSILKYELGPVSDLTAVSGDLTLAGILNIAALPGFAAGTYVLFTYTGGLIDEDGLSIVNLPANFEATVNTSTAGQIRLVVTPVLTAFEEWQIVHFGTTDNPDAAGNADPDGDGTLNEIEFRLGLDPENGASAFRASGQRVFSGFTLTWPSAPGLVFEVRRTPSLSGPWELLETIAPVVSGTATYTDTAPPDGRCFYRVILLP